MFSDTFLDGNIVRILREEVRHGSRVLSLQDSDVGFIILIRHGMAKGLLAIDLNLGVRRVSSTSIRLDADCLSSLGRNGEFDLVKVRKVVSRRSFECLTTREVLVGFHLLNVFDGDVVEGDQEGKFVNCHVLEHTLLVTFKAFSEGLRSVLVCVVGNKGNVRSLIGGCKLSGLPHKLANVLVVSHEDWNTGSFGFLLHFGKLGDSGSSGLFQVDNRAIGI
mmetsp:Transcript_13769/g.20166  ORF Transcript_13769/g.20166 Transcript_13769/m.20166 type:complete len:220 (-) Transcript_13769:518-1177(-)